MRAGDRSFAARVVLRFAFLYAALIAASNAWTMQVPFLAQLLDRYLELWQPLVVWTARHLLGLGKLTYLGGAISNTLYGLTFTFTMLALSALGALAWGLLGRRGGSEERIAAWLRWFLRLVVAFSLIHYGAIKLVPTQMIAPPPPGVLLFRLGDLRPNFLLWWFMGASPPFESITGLAELLAGLLLLRPRTTLLGALLGAADMLTVTLLNFAYDVHVKVYSLHLFVFALLLVLPDLRRLADLFLWNRRAEPRPTPLLSSRPWVERTAQGILLALGLVVLVQNALYTRTRYEKLYPPRSPFYGAWSVETFARDGREVPPHAEPGRWRWVTFARPESFGVTTEDEEAIGFRFERGTDGRTWTLARRPKTASGTAPRGDGAAPSPPPVPAGSFQVEQPQDDVLLLAGIVEGHSLRMRLRKLPLIR